MDDDDSDSSSTGTDSVASDSIASMDEEEEEEERRKAEERKRRKEAAREAKRGAGKKAPQKEAEPVELSSDESSEEEEGLAAGECYDALVARMTDETQCYARAVLCEDTLGKANFSFLEAFGPVFVAGGGLRLCQTWLQEVACGPHAFAALAATKKATDDVMDEEAAARKLVTVTLTGLKRLWNVHKYKAEVLEQVRRNLVLPAHTDTSHTLTRTQAELVELVRDLAKSDKASTELRGVAQQLTCAPHARIFTFRDVMRSVRL